MIKARRAAEQKAREDKIAEKLRRKAEKEAKRKAEEIARLREEIKEKYVDKVTPIEEILKQEITEIDGWSQDGKPVVTAIGGFLGQLMIVCNCVAKYYPQLDRPVKTGRSGGSRPKSQTSQKSGNKSERSAGSNVQSEIPRQILNPDVIQNFIYTYIAEKMKTEKFAMQVDARFEKYLGSLPKPIPLNEMRTIADEKYNELRKLLSNFFGSPILRIIKDNMEALEMDPEIFDLVYEGFWDLYTLHSVLRDVSNRKLQAWIQRIKLSSGPDRAPAKEEDGEGEENKSNAEEEGKEEAPKKAAVQIEGEDVIDPISAIVVLKIPKQPKEPELDDDGNEIPVEVVESELEDIPFEDKCLQMVSKTEDQRIWVINHLAQKTLRSEISAEFRASVDRLDNLDTQDFNFRLEKEATNFEELLLALTEEKEHNESKMPRVPVFNFRPKY